MADYHSYRFRAPIVDPTIVDLETFTKAADIASVWFTFHTDPDYGDEPCFGPGTVYEGPRFTCLHGIEVVNGVLEMGLWQANMLRDRSDDEICDLGAGVVISMRRSSSSGMDILSPESAEITDLDRLLTFLSKVTGGDPGDVQGCFASDYDEFGHANPIVRCSDGQVRVWNTPSTSFEWEESYGRSRVPVMSRIPADLVSGTFDGSFVRIDPAALRKRLEPIDLDRRPVVRY